MLSATMLKSPARLDFTRQGISVFDRDLRLVGWNREFRDLFGQGFHRIAGPQKATFCLPGSLMLKEPPGRRPLRAGVFGVLLGPAS